MLKAQSVLTISHRFFPSKAGMQNWCLSIMSKQEHSSMAVNVLIARTAPQLCWCSNSREKVENCWPEGFQQSRMNILKTAAHSKSICAGADSSSHFLRSLTVFFRVHLQLRRFKITDFVLTINVKDQLHYIKPFKTSKNLITKIWVYMHSNITGQLFLWIPIIVKEISKFFHTSCVYFLQTSSVYFNSPIL